jgi:hypothetical protein
MTFLPFFIYYKLGVTSQQSRCSLGSPDSPVNYSGARPEETREWPIRLLVGLTPALSGAPRQHTLSPFAPIFVCVPN